MKISKGRIASYSVTLVLMIIAGIFVDKFTKINILDSLLIFFKRILTYKIQIWIIGIIIFLSRIACFLFKKIHRRESKPAYINYAKDTFDGILYKWGYFYKKGKYCIADIIFYCPSCNCRIINSQCPICSAFFLGPMDIKRAEAIILYSVEHRFGVDEFKELGRSSDV